MGLNKEQWQLKRANEIIEYIKEHGKQVSPSVIYWDTWPLCIKDRCFLGAGVIDNFELVFGDFNKEKQFFVTKRHWTEIERKYLEEALADMKKYDELRSKKKK